MSSLATWEVARLQAVTAQTIPLHIPANANGLLIVNPLSAPIYVVFRASPDPSAIDFQVACPGRAMLAVPLIVSSDVTNVDALARVVYAGAVPPGDAGAFATMFASEIVFQPFVGPLA